MRYSRGIFRHCRVYFSTKMHSSKQISLLPDQSRGCCSRGKTTSFIVVNHLDNLYQGRHRMCHFVKYFYSGVKYFTGSTEIFLLGSDACDTGRTRTTTDIVRHSIMVGARRSLAARPSSFPSQLPYCMMI